MSWKERLLDQYGYLFNIDGDYTSVCNFIEELIKETEQRVLEEVDSLPKYFMTHNEEWIKIEDVNKLREKYKGE
jgi:hypothetical protein